MTLVTVIGVVTAVVGTTLGLVGAWLTSAADQPTRHRGFACWLVNSPALCISLACYGAWLLIPLNLAYFVTAWRGWRNTA